MITRAGFVEYLRGKGVNLATAVGYASSLGTVARYAGPPSFTERMANLTNSTQVAACRHFLAFCGYDPKPEDVAAAWAEQRQTPKRETVGSDPRLEAFGQYLAKKGLSLTSQAHYAQWVRRTLRESALTHATPEATIKTFRSGIASATSAWNHWLAFTAPEAERTDLSGIADVLPILAVSGWLEPLAAGAMWCDVFRVHGYPALRWKGTPYALPDDTALDRLWAWGCPDVDVCPILPTRPRSWGVPSLKDLRDAVKQARGATATPGQNHAGLRLPAFPEAPPMPGHGDEKRTPSWGHSERPSPMPTEIVFDPSAWTQQAVAEVDRVVGADALDGSRNSR